VSKTSPGWGYGLIWNWISRFYVLLDFVLVSGLSHAYVTIYTEAWWLSPQDFEGYEYFLRIWRNFPEPFFKNWSKYKFYGLFHGREIEISSLIVLTITFGKWFTIFSFSSTTATVNVVLTFSSLLDNFFLYYEIFGGSIFLRRSYLRKYSTRLRNAKDFLWGKMSKIRKSTLCYPDSRIGGEIVRVCPKNFFKGSDQQKGRGKRSR